jgi:hypothetical protein
MDSHYRCFITFAPNASMEAGSTITAAKLYFYGYSKSYALGVVNFSLIDYTGAIPPINGDYDSTTFTRQATDISNASFTVSAWNYFALTNLSRISTSGGNTTYMLTHSADVDNTSLTWASAVISGFRIRTIENSLGAYMVVTYTPPDTTPPASITNLANVTTCQNITWQWTNPIDADFNHTMVWRNDVFQYNLTNVTTSDLWESLAENTEYTFSSKTVDITGNVNATFVNLTSTTDTCPVPTTSPTTTATTVPPTTTTASPTPTPLPTSDCTYFNLTGVTFGLNSTDWNVTEGLNTWGVSTFNVTQGNVSWWICRAAPITTAPPTWQPLINPSTDIKTDWLGLLWQWWWLPVLILIMILLFRGK